MKLLMILGLSFRKIYNLCHIIFPFLLFVATPVFPERIFYVMGTYLIVDVNGREVKVYKYIKDLEEKLSDYIETSEVSKINKYAGIRPVKVSKETFEVIKISKEICLKTFRVFDITVGSYTINYKRRKILTKDKALSLINCEDILLNEKKREVFLKRKGMAIDLGGIGKGYAVEKAYKKVNTKLGFIAIAGDMKVWGHKRLIGVYNPLTKKPLLEGINKEDVCLSSSGNYFRKHIVGKDELLQVTVAYKNCIYADALATALFASDKETRKKILKNFKDAGVLILYKDGSFYVNRKFIDFFEYLIIKP